MMTETTTTPERESAAAFGRATVLLDDLVHLLGRIALGLECGGSDPRLARLARRAEDGFFRAWAELPDPCHPQFDDPFAYECAVAGFREGVWCARALERQSARPPGAFGGELSARHFQKLRDLLIAARYAA